MKIGLDIMGGDFAPVAPIEGAIMALDHLVLEDRLVLLGPQQLILEELSKRNVSSDLFDIVDAPDVIDMEDKPIKAFQNKPKSSLAVGFHLLKKGTIQAFTSAGNSGAVMVGSIYSVGNIQGVIRPVTVAFIPKETGGYNLLIDIGTNPDCKPDVLYQFGIIGSLYMESVFGIKKPKVCLLNIGTEEGKGNIQCQAAYQLMKDSADFNFVGNLENRDLFKNNADVFVCDGFVGNIVVKQIEAFYRLMQKRNLGDDFFGKFNYENHGGSPILGVNAPVVLGHGISSPLAIKNMILQCKTMVTADFTTKLTKTFAEYIEKIDNHE